MRASGSEPRSGRTERQTIIDLLQDQPEPLTLRDISQMAGLQEKEVLAHLAHIHRSMKTHRKGLSTVPARCRACGFSFAKKKNFKKPSRCPVCKGEFIDPPAFWI